MGIHRFGSFVANFPDGKKVAVNKLKDVSTLNIDANSIIHDAARNIYHYAVDKEEENDIREKLIQVIMDFKKKDFKKVFPKPSEESIDKVLSAQESGNFDSFTTFELFTFTNTKSEKELEKEHFKEIERRILKLYRELQPKTMVIAVDGLAPAAKIVQQRQRRYKSKNPVIFDSNSITPGTEFMLRLHLHLSSFFKSNKFNCKIIYSGYNIPGEGEHKIMDFYRNGSISVSGTHVVYGLDWDLIILCLLAKFENCYVFKGSNEFFNSSKPRTYFLSINLLRELFLEKVNNIEEFSVIASLVGNDFLPKNPAYTVDNLDKILEHFKELNEPLVVDGKIDYSVLKKLLYNTRYLLEENSKIEYTYSEPAFNNFTFENFKREWYTRALNPMNESPETFRLTKPMWDSRIERKKKMAIEYLKGLEWVLHYYTGRKINKSWYYPFHYSPENDNLIDNIGEKLTFDPEIEISMIDQLLSVIPPRSIELLSKIRFDKLKLQWLMPEICMSKLEGAHAEYEEILFVPFPNFELLKKVVKNIPVTEQYLPGTLITNELTIEKKSDISNLRSKHNITILQKVGYEINPILAKGGITYTERKSEAKREILEYEFIFNPDVYDYYLQFAQRNYGNVSSDNGMTYSISGDSGLDQIELEKLLEIKGFKKALKPDLLFWYNGDPELKKVPCKYRGTMDGLNVVTNKKTLNEIFVGDYETTDTLILKPVDTNQGNDIIIADSAAELKDAKEKLKNREYSISKYIKDVLLFDSKKFHIKIFIFVKYPRFDFRICSIGKIYTAKYEYSKDDFTNIDKHISRFSTTENDYYYPNDLVEVEDVQSLNTKILEKVSRIMALAKKSAKKPKETSDFAFDVLSADVLVTENLEPVIIEVNKNIIHRTKNKDTNYKTFSKVFYTELYNFLFN